jgi:predicted transcriptional regulator
MKEGSTLLSLTADVAVAYLSHNPVPVDAVGQLLSGIYGALASAGTEPEPEQLYEPAVNPKRSVQPDAITSLIDGKPYKMLRRHLTNHGLTPEEYRARYGLPANYPMVAPNYSERRRSLAKELGLGRSGHPRRGGRVAAAR